MSNKDKNGKGAAMYIYLLNQLMISSLLEMSKFKRITTSSSSGRGQGFCLGLCLVMTGMSSTKKGYSLSEDILCLLLNPICNLTMILSPNLEILILIVNSTNNQL